MALSIEKRMRQVEHGVRTVTKGEYCSDRKPDFKSEFYSALMQRKKQIKRQHKRQDKALQKVTGVISYDVPGMFRAINDLRLELIAGEIDTSIQKLHRAYGFCDDILRSLWEIKDIIERDTRINESDADEESGA